MVLGAESWVSEIGCGNGLQVLVKWFAEEVEKMGVIEHGFGEVVI